MSLQGTLDLLSNFNRAVEADHFAYEFFEKRLNIEEYRRKLQKIVATTPPESDSHGTDRASESERERRQLGRMLVEAELEKVELELILLALDFKLSMVAQRVREPFLGFFTQVGITPNYRLYRPSQRPNGTPNLTLVKKERSL